MSKTMRTVFITMVFIIVALACAVNTEAAQKYPYTKLAKTNRTFLGGKDGYSTVLLECERFPGSYWTKYPAQMDRLDMV